MRTQDMPASLTCWLQWGRSFESCGNCGGFDSGDISETSWVLRGDPAGDPDDGHGDDHGEDNDIPF
jgi:hypothetical protein